MDYKTMMEDCENYIKNHPDEELTPELFGKMYSVRAGYVSFLFQCYHEDSLDMYIKKVRIISGVEEVYRKYPSKRWTGDVKIRIHMLCLEDLYLESHPVIKDERSLYRPIDAAVDCYEKQNGDGQAVFWHRDSKYDIAFVQGKVSKQRQDFGDTDDIFVIPGGRYAVFSFGTAERKADLAESVKNLIHYAKSRWIPEHKTLLNEEKSAFLCFWKQAAYYCVPVLEEQRVPEDRNYGVEHWSKFIEENLTTEMTTLELANHLGYSGTQFKRKFNERYGIAVADYVRKQKIMKIAEYIRSGMDYMEVAPMYGFRTYVGCSRAFKKEFLVTPAVYRKGTFDQIDTSNYCSAWTEKINVAVLEVERLFAEVKPCVETGRNEPDIPAQIHFWKRNGFPSLHRERKSCNVELREDKVALWYHETDNLEHRYLVGPVVDRKRDTSSDVKFFELKAGKYALFSTERVSDERFLPETLEMFARCIFFGWIQSCNDRIDYERFSFERYVNNKLYFYVPLK